MRSYVRTPRSPQKKKVKIVAPLNNPSCDRWCPNEDVESWAWEDIEELVAEDLDEAEIFVGKKRSQASANPLLEWVQYKQEFIDESLRREARSAEGRAGSCVTCRKAAKHLEAIKPVGMEYTTEDTARERATSEEPMVTTGNPEYRCLECFGSVNECLTCCLMRHEHLPFHRIERWNGNCFVKSSLNTMGLRIQLGHESEGCTNPEPAPKVFVVLHVNGVHNLCVDYCNCETREPRRVQLLRAGWYPATVHYPATCATLELLKHFHGLSLCSKVSAHEYYMNLERLTDNSRVDVPNTRYKAFLRMMRQFRHERMMKRAGRGNIEDGIATAEAGDLALTCAACPQPGINLPDGWQSIPPGSRFLYSLFVAVDANFRLKNRLRSQETLDPGLHTGLAYFVPQKPYNEHILKFASQKDISISSCSGFSALARADSKSTSGLRYTGVGMCICARHELIRPLGVGDLQKGERYCNMDYIVLSAIAGLSLMTLTIIYDIACQWKANFPTRMLAFPSSLRIADAVHVDFAIPKCHLLAHQTPCQTPHSLNLKPGVGRTDGEGIERDWSMINPAANSTKEMGAGSRHNTLDDLFSHHNWMKTTGLGLSLRRKYRIAVVEAKRHKELFEEFSESVDNPELIKSWTEMIQDWEQDKSKPNPYVSASAHEGETSVKLKLMEAEHQDIESGMTYGSEKSATGFLAMGLALEESQRRIKLQAATKEMTALQMSQLQEKRVNVQRQIKQFRTEQRIYMPVVDTILQRDEGSKRVAVEDMPLMLPSDLDDELRESGCVDGLSAKEDQLREAQCQDALERIRLTQRAKRHIMIHKRKSQPGQRTGTRARSDFERLDVKISQAAVKYRTAHAALIRFRGGVSVLKQLPYLRDQDICPPPAFDVDNIEPARNLQEAAERLGEGRREIPWIWRTAGVLGDGEDASLNDGLRIEWAKGRARALRWSEEVLLCKEEMRRVRQTFEFRAQQWRTRISGGRSSDDISLLEGLSAYAHSQALVYNNLGHHFCRLWEAAPSKRSKMVAVPGPGTADAAAAEDECLMTTLQAEASRLAADDDDEDSTDDDRDMEEEEDEDS
ncbi:hypothetical protein PTI98_007984 [Pleurotus ostreatus]|nr:hypothetical protein PTI98_007984 [Pleurotus ostreatus]